MSGTVHESGAEIDGKSTNARRHVVYLGETFNLTHLIHATNPDPTSAIARHRYTQAQRYPNINRRETGVEDILRQQGAFILPTDVVINELFKTYFQHFHPHYPILHRQSFAHMNQQCTRPPSYILLQAVLFAASGHCDLPVLLSAGFQSRYQARLTFFRRAKALYDADQEADKIVLIQSMFLMSFWWNKSTDQKDTWYWLGNAVSLAVTIGMHRCTSDSALSLEDQRLWKRIWWSIYAEDKHAAAALGRPVHIRLKDCDVAPLSISDFVEEVKSDELDYEVFGVCEQIHVDYVICLTELSTILEKIIEASFCSHNQPFLDRLRLLSTCEVLLGEWRGRMPRELDLAFNPNGLWASALDIAYCWFTILVHRSPRHQHPAHVPYPLSSIASGAVSRIPQTVENLLSSSVIHHIPIHVIPSMFASMSMHVVDIRLGNAVRGELAQVKIRLCMIALKELKSTWPVAGWIYHLFSRILNRYEEREGEFLQDSVEGLGMHAMDSSSYDLPSGGDVAQQDMSFTPIDTLPGDGQRGLRDWSSLLSAPLHYPTEWDSMFLFPEIDLFPSTAGSGGSNMVNL